METGDLLAAISIYPSSILPDPPARRQCYRPGAKTRSLLARTRRRSRYSGLRGDDVQARALDLRSGRRSRPDPSRRRGCARVGHARGAGHGLRRRLHGRHHDDRVRAGAVADLNRLFDELAPRHSEYRHHLRWGDDNGSSHVRAALLGPSLTVPFEDGDMLLGTWQQIMLLEFDTSPRQREIVVQVMGDRKGE